ncbi:MAG: Molybdopterin molybdenumtransferase [uncultured Solirubrobacterales bacterium]|uniref:Molybdopterin molybdenumtransferase n=1 Tax=uncultured Solirubrobacterales bacterium TaxID=768556 RepID=A0A6J4SS61_9ACTN|nr:MAG: Molybdopterin molybdenumtransferase [uncultured Solirubrobacterales bacterium]
MAEALIDVATARARVLAEARPLAPEPVDLVRALGRVLAEDVASDLDLPPFDASAMDGFATRAGPAEALEIVGESRAGHPAGRELGAGEAIRISTGAVVPAGAQAVVPVERTRVTGPDGDGEAGERVRVPVRAVGEHVRRAGEDVRAGDAVMSAGTRLGPAEVAVLAALGRAEVRCGVRPRVAVLVTGDELVEPSAALGPGQIRDSNVHAMAAQAERAGARVVGRALVRDELEATVSALGEAIELADVVCVSGGVSVGPHDHVKPALARLGVRERFWGVALKPGKPTWFGVHGSTLVFGLPGNPVSAMVTFHLFARIALERLAGVAEAPGVRAVARLDRAVAREPRRDQAVRCRLEARPDGWHAAPTGPQGSHVLTSMLQADALALVPAGQGELAAGEPVELELLR